MEILLSGLILTRSQGWESKSLDEIMGYTVYTVDNKEYYSPDVQVIQGMLYGAVVVNKPIEEQLRELERKLMLQDVTVRC